MTTSGRVLVVHAHPVAGSYSHAVLAAVVRGLERSGRPHDVIDLYAEGFDARMSAAERAAYHGDEPVISDDVARHAALVRDAEALVFVYPTWWHGLPAVLKGWLDRVLVPGVAFRLDPETHRVRRGLTSVRRIVGVTTYGSPRWYVTVTGDAGRRTLSRTLRLCCHRFCRTTWLGLHGTDGSTEEQRHAFLARVETKVARL
jgi:NAD(P)H dehydrogenase (quinone)